MKKTRLWGYSDDCAHVAIEGKDIGQHEDTWKRLILTLPSGGKITATLEYDCDWGVRFEIPDDVHIAAEEEGEDIGVWNRIKTEEAP